ncbi:MAG: EscU/YscU/HrcU family type III secretion system export apparatus switch protein [Opitutales bacterium]|mgnify:CR=1 FL=1|jgi:flagellar biosynthetic protein FlhB|nr:EscU/YscU/HrcU family type III secretion system export apparatus switch protein [Opitutales bacterium]MDG2253989.1 EscU/YscU/HrcU family type III secretion system export apparatus switch protein [Opitutaceae bacterium]MBT5168836.1 EscU/YscU/HrcU family type III secretion system export apparatus switch protein [Opitutales bacterium]MBT5813609.1 EscU/YscU/HrcU family type III secretion system export apparatus switch protein [Opitutales bacterium]MBT6770458.1 EscU/YscU/HrcU family type III secr
MAETDKDSKTEQASSKRVDEAFEKGNFAQSPEIGMAFTLFAGLLVVAWFGKGVSMNVMNLTVKIFTNLSSVNLSENGIEYWSLQALATMSRLSGPFLLAGFIAAIIAGGLQSGFRLTPKALKFGFEKLNPIIGAKRLVSKDTLVKFGIDVLKLVAIGIVLYGAVQKIVGDPIFYAPIDFNHIGVFITDTIIYVFIRLVIFVSMIAAISYIYSKIKTATDLKMTKEEVKQERKDMDMSPEVRKARMAMSMRLMEKQMLDEVETADVIVTNPTHYAVAMKYERGVDEAPMVLAKGENAFALRIKEVAKESGVPIVENKLVARMLYKVGRVGQSIPAEMYQSVAEILAFVYKTHKYYFHKLKARRAVKSSR